MKTLTDTTLVMTKILEFKSALFTTFSAVCCCEIYTILCGVDSFEQEGVSVAKASELSISTKKESVKTLASKDLLYGRFVKVPNILVLCCSAHHMALSAYTSAWKPV